MQAFKPGLYPDMDIDVYHSSPGISSSGMKVFLESPAQYYYDYHLAPKLQKEPLNFSIGRALHILTLEPELFEKTFHVHDGDLPRANAAKEKLAQDSLGKTIIKAKDIFEIKSMSEALANHRLLKSMENKSVEHSLFWEEGVLNAPLRSRPDIYDDEIIVDIKTTASFETFERGFTRYGYHRQAAMQIDALLKLTQKDRKFYFLVVQKCAPYLVAQYELSIQDLEMGRLEYKQVASDYAECLFCDEWPTKCDDLRILQSYNTRNTDDE